MNTVTGTDTPAATTNEAAVKSTGSGGGGGGNVAQNPAFWNFLSSVVGTAGGIATAIIGNNQQQQVGATSGSPGFSFGAFSGGSGSGSFEDGGGLNLNAILPYLIGAAVIVVLIVLIIKKKGK